MRPAVAAVAVLFGATSVLVAQRGSEPVRLTETLFVGDQKPIRPGFAMGNVRIENPKVADVIKVAADRRELLLIGRSVGRTMLTLWDQKNVLRHLIDITVESREDVEVEAGLRKLLADFPSVEVERLGRQLVVTGAVSSKDDLAAIDRIAAVAKAKNLVRYVPPAVATTREPPPRQETPRLPGPAAKPPDSLPVPAPRPTPTPPPPTPAPSTVEFEIELLEASARFRSGSYARGVEPSGRTLYKGAVSATTGGEGEIFIGGPVVPPGSKKGSTDAGRSGGAIRTGIRLTLRPQTPDARDRFKTLILIETNLPIGTDLYDPAVWRRARWEVMTVPGEPFGITGGDLLATPDPETPGTPAMEKVRRGATTAGSIGSIAGAPGAEYVPIFGSLFRSRAYKQNTTQLLLVFRPRSVAPSEH